MFRMNHCMQNETMKSVQRCCLTQSQPKMILPCPQYLCVVSTMKLLCSGFVINVVANTDDMEEANFTHICASRYFFLFL